MTTICFQIQPGTKNTEEEEADETALKVGPPMLHLTIYYEPTNENVSQ